MEVVSLGLIFHEGGLIRVVFHRGWSLMVVLVFHGGGLSWGWSLVGLVSHKCGMYFMGVVSCGTGLS